MIYRFPHNRQSEAERRLCYQNPNTPSTTPGGNPSMLDHVANTIGETGRAVMNFVVTNATWLSAKAIEQLGTVVVGIPQGLWNGLNAAINGLGPTFKGLAERVTNLLYQAGRFFRNAPYLHDAFDRVLGPAPSTNIETLERLTRDSEWVKVFRQKNIEDILENPMVVKLPDSDKVYGPEEMLRALPPADRQRIYVEFIDRFIPERVQAEQLGIVRNEPNEKRYEAAKASMPVINSVFGAMMGMSEWRQNDPLNAGQTDMVESIARESLEAHYELRRDGLPENFISENLREDISNAYGLRSNADVSAIGTDAGLLNANLGNSFLSGALELGVIQQEELDTIFQGMEDRAHENRLAAGVGLKELQIYTGSQKERARLEAMTLGDTFRNMSGPEKLVLIGASLFALTQFKGVRKAALWGVGAYYFQRMVLKQKDPMLKWSELVGGISGGVKDTNAKLFGANATPGYIEQLNAKLETSMTFLDDFDRQDLITQATGYVLLNEMRLNDLAAAFQMEGPNGRMMHLNVAQGSPLDIELAKVNKSAGFKGYRMFFDNQKNQSETTEAISYMFFMRAAKSNPLDMKRAKEIVDLRGHFMPGTSLLIPGAVVNGGFETDSPDFYTTQMADPDMHLAMLNADEDYVKLVAKGRQLAMTESMTLGDFVRTNADLLSLMPRREPVTAKTNSFVPAPHVPSHLGHAPNVPSSQGKAPGIPSSFTKAPSRGSTSSRAPKIPSSSTRASTIPSSTTSAPGIPSSSGVPPKIPGGSSSAPGIPGSTTNPPHIPPTK